MNKEIETVSKIKKIQQLFIIRRLYHTAIIFSQLFKPVNVRKSRCSIFSFAFNFCDSVENIYLVKRIFILSSVVLIWIGHLWVMSFVNQQLEVEYFMEMLLQLLKSK